MSDVDGADATHYPVTLAALPGNGSSCGWSTLRAASRRTVLRLWRPG
ncbi:hypothetical protein ACR6C2_37710 [Streptomyces sp. INA 01156]